ncbi:MAG: uL22 family ribosomal protein [Candidatus Nanoarchaeia archaeon]|nr:uL22 family ribosomal protein [Candidatus Nanoarchaeia archaeon]MDD5741717.1 uL22 family ribosomal protein [Candidatus Nanoarchaeia archaeon]
MERPKQVDVKQNKVGKQVVRTEKVIAKDIAEIEEKVKEHEITQKEANKEIKEEVKEKVEEVREEAKSEIKKEKKEIKKTKKTEAVVNCIGLPISTKHAIAICNFIRGKNVDTAIAILEPVQRLKKAVPIKGEIPHRKGDMMSGRYPVKAAGEFIRALKSLKSNAIVNELELEKYVIFCKANIASRPYRKSGRARGKRTNLQLKLILPLKNKNKEDKK